jgi:hypothetical protein
MESYARSGTLSPARQNLVRAVVRDNLAEAELLTRIGEPLPAPASPSPSQP